MLIPIIIAMAAAHFLRPDLSDAAINCLCQKYRVFTPVFLSEGIAWAYDLLRDLSANLLLRAGRLASLPWRDYFDRALDFMKGVRFWSTFIEKAFHDAGYPEMGRWACLGVYFVAFAVVFTVVAVIRRLLAIVSAVITRLYRIVSTVFTWVFWLCRIISTVLTWVLCPLIFVLGLFRRLSSRRNGRPSAPEPGVHQSRHWRRRSSRAGM